MIDDKKPAQECEVYIYGNTKVEFRRDGLTVTVMDGEGPPLTPGDIGSFFKALREDAELTLEETAKATEIEVTRLKAIEKYGLKYKDREFYNLCHLFQQDSKKIAKRYNMPPSQYELRAQAWAKEHEEESQAEVNSAKPNKQYPVRAMFISLLLTNVATLLLCAGQLLMWLVG